MATSRGARRQWWRSPKAGGGLGDAKLENRVLADSGLSAVTGGTKAKGSGSASFFEALAQAWGKALDAKADLVQQ
jgi:hypothetical protein